MGPKVPGNQFITEGFDCQFQQKIVTSIQQDGRINTKICRQEMSILFNQICLNEEMIPRYTHTYICALAVYRYMYIYIYIY